jgi:hypothetical protein
MADATVTQNTYNVVAIPTEGKEWAASAYSADWQDCGVIKAAESGYSHYIKKLMVRGATTCFISIGSGATTNAVTTIHIGPIDLNAAGGAFAISFGELGLKCTSGLAIYMDSSASGKLWVHCEGKTCLG